MARKRVTLAYIRNAAKRKAAFKKRKTGLLKKISEITTLCGIQACAVIYSPDEAEPTVWPSNEGINDVISRFKGVSEVEQTRKMLCQESLVRKNILKAQSQLQKLRIENRKKEITLFLYQYLAVGESFLLENINADIIDLNDIAFLTNKKLEEIEILLENKKKKEVTQGAENGSGDEAMTQSENENESDQVQGSVDETSEDDAMQDVNWPVDNINADDGDEDGMLTLDNVNVGSGWLNHFMR